MTGVCVVCLAIGSVAGSAGPAYAEPASSAAGLSPFTHSPDLFPILPWDRLHGQKRPAQNPRQGLESIAECGFTLAGFVTPEDLPLCETLGLAAILAPLPGQKPWRQMSEEETDRRVKEMVEKVGKSKAVFGYYIQDEPGAPAFPALARADSKPTHLHRRVLHLAKPCQVAPAAPESHAL